MSYDQRLQRYAELAKERAIVTLADGRTARLVYWPALPSPGYQRRSKGARCRVMLPSGAMLSVPCSEVRW